MTFVVDAPLTPINKQTNKRILQSALRGRTYWTYTACKKAVSIASVVLSLCIINGNMPSLKSYCLRWRSIFFLRGRPPLSHECFRSKYAV